MLVWLVGCIKKLNKRKEEGGKKKKMVSFSL